MAWLCIAGAYTNRSGHMKAIPDLIARQEAREMLAQLPGSDRLFEKEREKRDGEPDEPEEIH